MEIQQMINELREDAIKEFIKENLSQELKDFILKLKERIGEQKLPTNESQFIDCKDFNLSYNSNFSGV